mmetsp:Transcript_15475/g.34646  ORF Transcript_15475/g.34646 Transcript_15475/m.34646 type:complete len:189 (+) Transcript_15475:671-1237(+)
MVNAGRSGAGAVVPQRRPFPSQAPVWPFAHTGGARYLAEHDTGPLCLVHPSGSRVPPAPLPPRPHAPSSQTNERLFPRSTPLPQQSRFSNEVCPPIESAFYWSYNPDSRAARAPRRGGGPQPPTPQPAAEVTSISQSAQGIVEKQNRSAQFDRELARIRARVTRTQAMQRQGSLLSDNILAHNSEPLP